MAVASLLLVGTAAARPDLDDSPTPEEAGIAHDPGDPFGWLDGVDGNGVATGWTCDPDDFSRPLYVHLYVDGPAGSGSYVGQAYADLTREPAVGDVCGGWRNHGYGWQLPSWLWDGQWHTLYAHAISVGSGGNALLQGSGTWFRLGGSTPLGWLDVIDSDGVAHGWTCDADDLSRPLQVHFYADGSFVGAVEANLTREPAVGDVCGGWRNHGYRFILPESVRDSEWHSLSAWAINLGPGPNVQLNGSPSGFRLDPSLENESFDWGEWGIEAVPSDAVQADPPKTETGMSPDETEVPQEAETDPVTKTETGTSPEAETEVPQEAEAGPAREETGSWQEAERDAPQGVEAGPAGETETGPPGEAEGDVQQEVEAGSGQEPEADSAQEPEAGSAPGPDADRSEEVGAERSQEDEPGPSEGPEPSESPETSSTRCEWHNFEGRWKQTRLYTVLRYGGYFRICYVPNDRILSVTNMWGDASWVCGWCGWRWLGNSGGYPTHLNFGSHAVLKYRGTLQFCPPHFWCIGTRQPWVELIFYPNGTKRQVIGVD